MQLAPRGQPTRQRYKVVLIGAPGAGKTALVRRLADGTFVDGARPRGLDFYTCQLSLRDDVNVTLQLWDLSDCPSRPEDDHAPLSTYIFNSQAVLFLYDVSVPNSLEELRYAFSAVEAAVRAARGAQPYFALVGTKCDLPCAVPASLVRELAARHGCVRFTVSARTGQGVTEAAVQLACDLVGVPVAATEYAGRFAAGLAPIGPEGASLIDQGAPVHGGELGLVGTGVPTAAAAAAATAVPPGLGQRHLDKAGPQGTRGPAPSKPHVPSGGCMLARGPALYREASGEQRPGPAAAQASPVASVAESGARSLGGGSGAAAEFDWRTVSSRKASGSSTAVLVSKTGPLGQRMVVGRPTTTAAPTDAPGVGSPVAVDRQGSSQQQAQWKTPGVSDGGKAPRKGWRLLCCCSGGGGGGQP